MSETLYLPREEDQARAVTAKDRRTVASGCLLGVAVSMGGGHRTVGPGRRKGGLLQSKVGLAHLDALDAEAERGAGADAFPPLHIARLGDCALRVLFLSGRPGVYRQHFLVHVLPLPAPR